MQVTAKFLYKQSKTLILYHVVPPMHFDDKARIQPIFKIPKNPKI